MSTQIMWNVRTCPEHGLHSVREADKYDHHNCVVCFRPLSEEFAVVRASDPSEDTDGLVSAAHGETSRLAALKIRPHTGTQRFRILMLVEGTGRYGLTRETIAEYLHISPDSVRPRVRELIDGGHLFVIPGLHRRLANGNFAEVLIASEHKPLLDDDGEA